MSTDGKQRAGAAKEIESRGFTRNVPELLAAKEIGAKEIFGASISLAVDLFGRSIARNSSVLPKRSPKRSRSAAKEIEDHVPPAPPGRCRSLWQPPPRLGRGPVGCPSSSQRHAQRGRR